MLVSRSDRPPTGRLATPPTPASKIRVFVVDDSAVVRGFITRLLAAEPDIEVVGTANDGASAVQKLSATRADVVVLDVEMPVLDGLTALPQILATSRPAPKVVMASTLTNRGAAISIQALVKGAADYVPKPTSMSGDGAPAFGRDLLEHVRIWGAAAQRERQPQAAEAAPRPIAPRAALAPPSTSPSTKPAGRWSPKGGTALARGLAAEALAVGCSTGGPQALLRLFKALVSQPLGPIFVTQHMPPTFTAMFAEQLARASGRPCHEVIDHETAQRGVIYLAPGDWHMVAERRLGEVRLRRLQTPPENYCRPSVDPMLRSLASIYENRLLTLILTGMGHDGLAGSRAVVERGGVVLAQDEASSVVWGMPGAVAQAGVASELLDVDQLAQRVTESFRSQP
ncbi:MAG: chemotaxis response regulator protein-glutamate methylesterase [Geminicoccaceae bacterium]|nr:MAG: chemotaxis response regulator protein-glutamate methylesterase [Geminicoccaceae bacterium]